MVDNYDSFTYNLVEYFRVLGEEIEVVRNDTPLSSIDLHRYRGIILSPGPSGPENSGITLDIIRTSNGTPLLGVCLGMQAMVLVLGGEVVRAMRVMHGKVDRVRHRGGELFSGVPEEFDAVRYHSLAAREDSLPACLEVMARASDGEIMAVRHRERNAWGVQFHPESYLTEHGLTMLRNFTGGCG
ncbi:MAG TPA: aminodeoxychorismate/anthranilate synthase component II [Spirochaetota bacterium]|nr:aminodeoxychorismate/anthranilate synthase component II [Spirochaetota bacterium]